MGKLPSWTAASARRQVAQGQAQGRGDGAGTKSIALALAARGLTQQQIGDKLGVTHQTVGLANFGTVPELANEPALPDAAALDAIARKR